MNTETKSQEDFGLQSAKLAPKLSKVSLASKFEIGSDSITEAIQRKYLQAGFDTEFPTVSYYQPVDIIIGELNRVAW